MLKIAMICMLVAVVILAVCVCVLHKNNYLSFLLKTLCIIALVCLGFIVANFKDDFSGFSILVILSMLPMILSTFDLKQMFPCKKMTETNAENQTEIIQNNETSQQSAVETTRKNVFRESNGKLFLAIGLFLSAVCLSIASLYIGKETFYGVVIGVLIGGGATFVLLALKKIKNPIDIVSYFLIFVSVGLMVGNIILTLLYSFSTTNIMFSVGCLLLGSFSIVYARWNKSYLNAVYYASAVFLLLSILL